MLSEVKITSLTISRILCAKYNL